MSEKRRIVELKDDNEELKAPIFPLTHVKAVIGRNKDNNESTLDRILEELRNDVNFLLAQGGCECEKVLKVSLNLESRRFLIKHNGSDINDAFINSIILDGIIVNPGQINKFNFLVEDDIVLDGNDLEAKAEKINFTLLTENFSGYKPYTSTLDVLLYDGRFGTASCNFEVIAPSWVGWIDETNPGNWLNNLPFGQPYFTEKVSRSLYGVYNWETVPAGKCFWIIVPETSTFHEGMSVIGNGFPASMSNMGTFYINKVLYKCFRNTSGEIIYDSNWSILLPETDILPAQSSITTPAPVITTTPIPVITTTPKPEAITPITDYFTIVSKENNNNIRFISKDIEYTFDRKTWFVLPNDGIVTINAGEEIRFRNTGIITSNNYGIGYFKVSKQYSVKNNIMSLIYGEDFRGKTNIPKEYIKAFKSLFEGEDTLIDARELILPATTLSDNCYESMFEGCTNLIGAPELPANDLTAYCYSCMFYNCVNLTIAPELPAANLAEYCYNNMFSGCTRLAEIPKLKANNLKKNCYSMMFSRCANIEEISSLPALNLSEHCYDSMFSECTSLTKAPELKASDLAEYCYQGMFSGCTSLTTALSLPATTLTTGCYNSMFEGCSNLSYIKMLATTNVNNTTLNNWVNGVSETGTFFKDINTFISRGIHGIPEKWSIINHGTTTPAPEIPSITTTPKPELVLDANAYLTIVSLEDNNEVSFNSDGLYYSIDNWNSWNTLTKNSPITINKNEVISFKGTLNNTSQYNYSSFSTTKLFYAGGNIMSLLYNDDFRGKYDLSNSGAHTFRGLFKNSNITKANLLVLPATTLASSCYAEMFSGCSNLTTAPELPSETLQSWCYYYMFYKCTSLTTAPKLPATKLSVHCYESMFSECTSLKETPQLLANTLAQSCYGYMFSGCTSLTKAHDLPATTADNYCYRQMFRDCTSLETAPKLLATKLDWGCYDSMFMGCTSLTQAPELLATTLDESCYEQMFLDCTKLSYIKMLATDISATDCLNGWVENVSSSGTFVKDINTTISRGIHGIPENWKITNHGVANTTTTTPTITTPTPIVPTIDPRECLTFEALDNNIQISFSNNYEYCIDYSGDWNEIGGSAPTINAGQTISIKNSSETIYNSTSSIGTFYLNGRCNVKGNVRSLLTTGYYLWDYCFSGLFSNCSMLISAKDLILPDLDLPKYCYRSMFSNCTSLTAAPELPATTLGQYCYSSMFSGCTSLTEAPVLPATTLESGCYSHMFYNCSRLSSITMLADNIADTALGDWVFGVASFGSFYKKSTMNSLERGDDGIPLGWDVYDDGSPTPKPETTTTPQPETTTTTTTMANY